MLKRDFTLFIRCLGASVLLLVLLVSVSAGVAVVMTRATNAESDKIHVAVVDNEDSVLSRILIHTVSDTEYIRSLIEAETMEEEDALRAIRDGSSAAAILLPSDFVRDMAGGTKATGRVYLSPALASQSDIIASTLRFGERILVAGQYGVFAGERLLREHRADATVRDRFLTASNTGLLSAALSGADTYFTTEELSYGSSGLSTDAYFTMSALTALLFLISLFFTPLFMRDCTRDMLCRLATYGIGSWRYMMWKTVLLTLFRYILCLSAIFLLASPLGLEVDLLSPFIAALYVTVVGACLTMCTGDGITANTLVTLCGMLLCGGLIPLHLLPDSVQLIGRLTPFGAAQSLLAPVFGANMDWGGLIVACIYALISALLIHRRLQRTLTGRAM